MASNSISGFIRTLRGAARGAEGPTDGDLLQAYVAQRDNSAFAELVRRHGPMVLGVCRRVLGNEPDAEDAFQATFLVLAKKAASLRPGGLVGNWLYGVANNTARKARAMARKRRAWERQAPALSGDRTAEGAWRQAQALLDEELNSLPEKYRAPIVLCALGGKTITEAARELGCPQGTLATRLARGRALLGKRLGARGWAVSAGAISAGVPPGLLNSTAEAARLFAAGEALEGLVPAAVNLLVKGALTSMTLTRLKITAATLLVALGMLGSAAWAFTRLAPAGPSAGAAPGAASRGSPASRAAGAKGDRELEGEWRLLERRTPDRKEAPALRLLLRPVAYHFQGDRFRVTAEGRDVFAPGTAFKLDPSRDPKTIDLTVTRDGKAHTFRGIYSVGKGRLRLCISFAQPSKRPREFKPDKSIGAAVEVLERIVPKGRGARAPAEEFAAILLEWGRAERAREKALDRARTPEEREKAQAESRARVRRLAERSLRVGAEDEGPVGLAALCWAAARSPGSAAGKKALAELEGGRLAKADLGDLSVALENLREPLDHEAEAERFARAVLKRVRRQPDHPDSARLLCWVCTRSFHFNPPKAPPSFAGAAELIVERFAASPDIANFCECLGSIGGTPRVWARDYEKHLRTILKKNKTRRVRGAAHFALARVVASAGAARQGEAEELFRSFLKEFDGKDPTLGTEESYRFVAAREIKEIQARGLGKPAPPIEGDDLDGKPMKLSDFKGKVVLLSFWGTWCAPCMRCVPHERKLVQRLRGKPFALVGVNQDRYDEAFRARLRKEKITWRSFKNQRPGRRAVAQEWGVQGWPTFYLIDHAGVIRGRWVGEPDPETLDREVDRLVEKAKSVK